MILSFTDFGPTGPYIAQMQAVIRRIAPSIPFIDLLNDAPMCNPRASAYLLAALVPQFPKASVFLGVVDPGVGTERQAVVMTAGDQWFVGPDNGLFEIVARRAGHAHWWQIGADADNLSASFHGRDLFAPTAARIVTGQGHDGEPTTAVAVDWPDDLAEVIYVDHYGNVITGLRAKGVERDSLVSIGGHSFAFAETFGRAEGGFWYENSIGLIEIALPGGRATDKFSLTIGDPVSAS